MSEGFFSRWSRRKQDAVAAQTETRPVPAPQPASAPVDAVAPHPPEATVQPARRAPSAQSADAPALPSLEDVRALIPSSDFQPFMQQGVAREVRNAALKKLFADPHFNVMDGLDIYIEDYGQPDPLPAGMLRQMASAQFLRLTPEQSTEPATASVGDAAVPEVTPGPVPPQDTQVVAQSPDSSAPADPPAHDNPDLQLQPDPAAAHPQPRPGPR